MRPQTPVPIPNQLFTGQPSGPLHEPSLNLAHINRGVQGRAHIMDDIAAQNPVFSRQGVHRDLAHRRTIGKIIKRPPTPRDPVPRHLGRLVIPGRGQADPRLIAPLGRLIETDLAPRAIADLTAREPDVARVTTEIGRNSLGHPRLDHLTGRPHRHAVQIRPRRCRRGRGVGHLARVRCGYLDPLNATAETGIRDLRHLLEQALSHLGAAMVHLNRPVAIDMDQGPRLIEVGQRERNPELHRRQRHTALDHSIVRIPRRHGRTPRSISRLIG